MLHGNHCYRSCSHGDRITHTLYFPTKRKSNCSNNKDNSFPLTCCYIVLCYTDNNRAGNHDCFFFIYIEFSLYANGLRSRHDHVFDSFWC